ncbi:MAG: hypothetical protein WAK00_03560 [Microbacterium sp.]|uniref:hypothetical protein n=1 Tax=Microbacterium sp. TaxID=51671 RepID=UPI003BB0DA0B
MAQFILERVIAAPPADVFAASLDPALHVRSMARYGETMVEAPDGGVFREGRPTWKRAHTDPVTSNAEPSCICV